MFYRRSHRCVAFNDELRRQIVRRRNNTIGSVWRLLNPGLQALLRPETSHRNLVSGMSSALNAIARARGAHLGVACNWPFRLARLPGVSMLGLPDIPILVLRRDYALYPWQLLDREGSLLAIGRHGRKEGRSTPDRRVLHFSSAAETPMFTITQKLRSCILSTANGAAYGTVRLTTPTRRHHRVRNTLASPDGHVVGKVSHRPHQEPDPRLRSAPGPSDIFISDSSDTDVGQVFSYRNYQARRIELHFGAPVSTELVVLCIAAHVMSEFA